MPSKRQSEIYRQRNRLNHQGWDIPDTENCIRPNSGSESLSHLVAKCAAAKVCIDAGYRVQSEVQTESGDEADILAFGLEDRLPIVLELENGLTEEVRQKKLKQYTIGDVRECFIVDLDNSPTDPDELYEHIAEQTGLLRVI